MFLLALPISSHTEPEKNVQPAVNTPTPPPSIRTTPVPTETPDPIPDFKVSHWKYPWSNDNSLSCSYNGFLGSCTPQKYIMPDNEVIKYTSDYLGIDNNGALVWKDNNPFGLSGVFVNTYVSDQEQFGQDDYWANPDWYLTHGMKGDCEDSALFVASILESKGIKVKIVGGWLTYNNQRTRDWIVEYKIDPVYYRYFGGAFNVGFMPRGVFELYKKDQGVDFEPVLMFDRSSYYEDYNKEW